MVNYDMRLYEWIQKSRTIVLPWDKYQYQGLPTGVSIDLDEFQDKMSTLFQYMVYVCVYLYNLVIYSNDTFKNHMGVLDDVIILLKNMEWRSMQLNASGIVNPLVI